MYQCPNPHNCGEYVAVDFGTFADTTVTVDACSTLKAQGWASYQVRKSAASTFIHKDDVQVRFKDGLVTFSGSLS